MTTPQTLIRTEEENDRLIAELQELDARSGQLTPEERQYADLLTLLIKAFEEANYTMEGSTRRQPAAQSDG